MQVAAGFQRLCVNLCITKLSYFRGPLQLMLRSVAMEIVSMEGFTSFDCR
jgi:hypothetical protein